MSGDMHKPKSHYRHMTRAKAHEIRRAYFAREASQVELAARYGVRQGTISRIISNQVWA
jgi:DNA-binding transcriptional regulator LsrR (DeoR family)